MPLHEIERAQLELVQGISPDASVVQTIAEALGLGMDAEELQGLIGRQIVEADRHVDRFYALFRNVRRAGVGCGFVAGVTFAAAVQAVEDAGRDRPT